MDKSETKQALITLTNRVRGVNFGYNGILFLAGITNTKLYCCDIYQQKGKHCSYTDYDRNAFVNWIIEHLDSEFISKMFKYYQDVLNATPIILERGTNRIIEGHARWASLKEHGFQEEAGVFEYAEE